MRPMSDAAPFEIFLAAPPGLEPLLRDEAAALGLPQPKAVPGGVTFTGGWPEVWRANLHLRGATRVLARIARLPRPPPRPARQARAEGALGRDAAAGRARCASRSTTRASRIWHAGAARERIAGGDPRRARRAGGGGGGRGCGGAQGADRRRPLHRLGRHLGRAAPPPRPQAGGERGADARDAGVALPARRRGTAGASRSSTRCAGRAPSSSRRRRSPWASPRALAGVRLRAARRLRCGRLGGAPRRGRPRATAFRFRGSDRDAGAVAMSRANAVRAGVAAVASFVERPIGALERPRGAGRARDRQSALRDAAGRRGGPAAALRGLRRGDEGALPGLAGRPW